MNVHATHSLFLSDVQVGFDPRCTSVVTGKDGARQLKTTPWSRLVKSSNINTSRI